MAKSIYLFIILFFSWNLFGSLSPAISRFGLPVILVVVLVQWVVWKIWRPDALAERWSLMIFTGTLAGAFLAGAIVEVTAKSHWGYAAYEGTEEDPEPVGDPIRIPGPDRKMVVGWTFVSIFCCVVGYFSFLEKNVPIIPKLSVEAFKRYRKMAKLGIAEAQAALGDCYRFGHGVSEDKKEATRWYRIAIKNGHRAALAQLEDCLDNMGKSESGMRSHTVNHAERDVSSQYAMSRLYRLGDFVPKDIVLAYMWFNIAERGADSSPKARDQLAKDLTPQQIASIKAQGAEMAAEMTPEQIAEAQKLSREWKARHERRKVRPGPSVNKTASSL